MLGLQRDRNKMSRAFISLVNKYAERARDLSYLAFFVARNLDDGVSYTAFPDRLRFHFTDGSTADLLNGGQG